MEGNDHAIIRAVLAGDKDAYGLLVARHSQNVFRVAFRITGDEADADEVVQDAFLRGYQRLEGFESRSEFGTWIYRIAVNCALNMVNKRKVEATYQIGEETDPERQQVQLADTAADPERSLLSREIEALQKTAMRDLSATEKAVPSFFVTRRPTPPQRLLQRCRSLRTPPNRLSFVPCRSCAATCSTPVNP